MFTVILADSSGDTAMMMIIGGLISLFLFMGWRRWNPRHFRLPGNEEDQPHG
jgi:hypothetical protein